MKCSHKPQKIFYESERKKVLVKGNETITSLDSKNIQEFQSTILWLLLETGKHLNNTTLNIV